jgi:hypothetical protein
MRKVRAMLTMKAMARTRGRRAGKESVMEGCLLLLPLLGLLWLWLLLWSGLWSGLGGRLLVLLGGMAISFAVLSCAETVRVSVPVVVRGLLRE